MDLHFEICCQILEGESPHEDALWNYSYLRNVSFSLCVLTFLSVILVKSPFTKLTASLFRLGSCLAFAIVAFCTY